MLVRLSIQAFHYINRGGDSSQVISSISAGSTQRFECKGMRGRYVSVVIPGRSEVLTLCEVEVYGSRLDPV